MRWLRLGAAAVAFLLLLAGVGVFALLVIVAFAGRQIRAGTRLRRVALAILVLFGANAALLTVLAVFRLPVDIRIVAATYLLVGALAPSANNDGQRLLKSETTADRWAVAAAALTFAVFYRPFAFASLGRRLALLSYSTDAGTHLSYVRSNLEQGSYLHDSQYPQAWAGNVGLVIAFISGRHPSAGTFIAIAVPIIVAFYALLAYCVVALVLEVVQSVAGRLQFAVAALAVGCVGLSMEVGSTNLLLKSSSYTEIVAVAVLVAFAVLLLSPPDRSWRQPLTVGLLSLALMQTWYLLAPVLGVLVLVYLATFRPRVVQVVVVGAPVGALALYPILNGPAAVTQINAAGGTPFPTAPVALGLFLLTLFGSALLLLRKPAGCGSRVVEILAVATLLLTALIVMLQATTAGGINYYVAKLLFVVFLFGVMACACAVGIEIDRAAQRAARSIGGHQIVSASLVSVILGGLTYAWVNSLEVSGSYPLGRTPALNDGKALDAIFAEHPSGFEAGTEAWVVDGCARANDRIANKWSHDLFAGSDGSWSLTNGQYVLAGKGDVTMLTKRLLSGSIRKMEIYVHHECDTKALATLATAPNVTVKRVP